MWKKKTLRGKSAKNPRKPRERSLGQAVAPRQERFGGIMVPLRDALLYRGVGVPDEFLTTLRYSESVNMAGPTAIYAFQSSLFDPNFTGTGHQPSYFDQICPTLYARYQVLAMRATIRFSNLTANQSVVSFCWSDSTSVAGYTTLNVGVQPHGSFKEIGPLTGPSLATFKTYMTATVIHGNAGGDVSQTENQSALYNASPADPYYLFVSAANVDDTLLAAPGIQMTIDIKFECRFFERYTQAPSLDGSIKHRYVGQTPLEKDDLYKAPKFDGIKSPQRIPKPSSL